jgi:hypothetical protein
MLPDDTHEKMIAKWMQDPAIRAEVERIEREESRCSTQSWRHAKRLV